jgi:hypothetical protein
MKDVVLGNQTAIFPEPDGGLVRPVGKTIGGGKVVVFLLTTKCNQYVFFILTSQRPHPLMPLLVHNFLSYSTDHSTRAVP